MRIQHNINALNSHRNLSLNTTKTGKNLEKLSSGYRINRAGDDAAGLAISEKMRGQINGLAQAQSNAQDGISLIQTAEGGLNETHAILQKMRTLAVQSSNGTYQNEVDRENINKEVNALKTEIDRIASSTHYNKINLLDGSLGSGNGSSNVKVEAGSMAAVTFEAETATAGSFVTGTAVTSSTAATINKEGTFELRYVDEEGTTKSLKVNYTATTTAADATGATTGSAQSEILKALKDSELGDKYDITMASNALTFTAKDKGSTDFTIIQTQQTLDNTDSSTIQDAVAAGAQTKGNDATFGLELSGVDLSTVSDTSNAKFEIDGQKFQVVALGSQADEGYNALYTSKTTGALAKEDVANIASQLRDNYGVNVTNATQADPTTGTTQLYIKKADINKANGGLTFQIGANGVKDQRVSLSVGDMSSKGIGIAGISVATQDDANAAIDVIDKAINTVSGTRADLGALQNRLEHTVNNLAVTEENLTSSESRIRDVDMAKEMMDFTKNNILTQAAQAMLAQANQQPQGVLQLLQ